MKQILHIKWRTVAIACFVMLVLTIGIVVVMKMQTKGFRDIRIFDLEGIATLQRDEQTMNAYKGMQMENRDILTQAEDGNTQLILDEEKYVILEPCTTIQLFATGKEPDSNTTIHLVEGSIINHLRAPLSWNSTYEVTTPVGVMAVRGTTYRVTVVKNKDGSYNATLEVFSGSVGVCLINPDQTISQEIYIDAGMAAEIFGNQDVTEFVFTNQPIKYEKLPIFVIEQLISWLEEGVLTMEQGVLDVLKEVLPSQEEPVPASSQSSSMSSQTLPPIPPQAPIPESPPQPSQTIPPKTSPAPLPEPEEVPFEEPDQIVPPTESSAASKPRLSLPSKINPKPSPDSETTHTPEPDSAPSPSPSPAYYTVTFKSGSVHKPGGDFAKQQVPAGETVEQPELSPSSNFQWYTADSSPYAFNTPIRADLILYNRTS